MGVKYPRMVFIDNADDSTEELVRGVLGQDVLVGQDVKHWINRLIKTLNKENHMYTPFCVELHGCVTDKPLYAKDRNGDFRKAPARILLSDEIERRIENLMNTHIRTNSTIFREDKGVRLFEKQWAVNKSKIRFVMDAVDEDSGLHYFEAEDGHFYLYRGTNKNESFHRRLRLQINIYVN